MSAGHIYRRRKANGNLGNWNAVIDIPRGTEDRRKQVTRTFPTERQARLWLAEMVTQAAQPAQEPALTVGEYLHTWLESLDYARPSTRATYRSHVDRYLIPILGGISVEELRQAQVLQLVEHLRACGLHASSVQRVLSTLSTALRSAMAAELVTRNPVWGVKVPGESPRPLPSWTVDDCRRFLEGLGTDELDICLRLALTAGLRRGELLGLRWGDLDLGEGLLHVRCSRVAVGGAVVEGQPKSASGVRTVYLDSSTSQALRELAVRQRSRIPVGTQATQLVFTSPEGIPWAPWWLSRQFEARITALGLSRIRFHDLRHASATMGLASGETLREISARLGHSDISVTARTYTEVVPDQARASSIRRAEFMSRSMAELAVVR